MSLEDHSLTVRTDEDEELAYDFDELDELAHAYAVTIHRSQGSEYPAVVIPLTTSAWMMLQRNLLYTGHHAREEARRPRGLTPRARRGGTHGGRRPPPHGAGAPPPDRLRAAAIRRVTLTAHLNAAHTSALAFRTFLQIATDMAHMDCCGPSRRQALPGGSLAAAVPATVGAVSAESAKASTTDLLVTDLEVATVTDTSVIIALVHRPGDRGGHLRIPAPRRGRHRTADRPRRPDGTDRRARGTQDCPGVTRAVPEPDHQPRTVTMTAAPKCSTKGIHLTGLGQVSGSPGPGRPWPLDARRLASLGRRGGWLRLGLGVGDQVPVPHRIVPDGEFEHTV